MRSVDLRAENRYRLIDGLRHLGPCTRASLGRLTGLSAAAISTLTAALAAEGVVLSARRDPLTSQRRGRPENVVVLAPGAALVLTVAMTVDQLRLNVLRYDGSVMYQSDSPMDFNGYSAQVLVSRLIERIDAMLPAAQATRLRQISVGFQGITSPAEGLLVWSPILQVRDIPIRAALAKRYGVPVNVNNDCRLISQALHDAGHQQLGSHFITLLLSYGIGMALHIDGKTFSGVSTSAMEIGHLPHVRGGALCRCGLSGCLEAYAADYAIVRHADGLDESSKPSGRITTSQLLEVARRARGGESLAIEAFERAGTAVGEGLAMMFRLLDPIPVALVGHVITGFDLMQAAMQRSLDATLGEHCALEVLAHPFHQEDQLLQAGLALDALSSIDRQLAIQAAL